MIRKHLIKHNDRILRLKNLPINFTRSTSSSSSFIPLIRRFKPSFLNHFGFIDKFITYLNPNFKRTIIERDRPTIIDKISTLQDKSTYSTNVQPLIKYLNPLVLSNYELAIISNGLTNLELHTRIDNTSIIYESDKIRSVGQNIYRLLLVNQLKIFQNLKYLSNSENEIESDLNWVWDNSIILKFMKLNGLSNSITINSEFLINEFIDHDLYQLKKQKVINATTIGSFYTMIGLISIKYKQNLDNETIDKILNGKRGIFNILKDNL
ncbi:hypothetical protein KGF54_000015 [Candida jiufengensis]|uniref:uncharacterized protein n=1 Tax=Candida jiufengensis TaxID=497108 RepID=UPI0022249B00|nr:uncharacterized protein KGF54_000015 [Candida jiufengensis]KAI5957087.1 hypothetical protein KGF54_000015 [Candida jiufengensis]